MILKVSKKIINIDPNAIIIFQGDHGSAFGVDWNKSITEWTENELRERSGFINMVKAPKECTKWLKNNLGQINTIRFVFGCLQGKKPNYLQEKSYLSVNPQNKDFGKFIEYELPKNEK